MPKEKEEEEYREEDEGERKKELTGQGGTHLKFQRLGRLQLADLEFEVSLSYMVRSSLKVAGVGEVAHWWNTWLAHKRLCVQAPLKMCGAFSPISHLYEIILQGAISFLLILVANWETHGTQKQSRKP